MSNDLCCGQYLRQMAAYNGTRGLWQQRHAILSGIFLRAKAIVWGQLGGDGLAIALNVRA